MKTKLIKYNQMRTLPNVVDLAPARGGIVHPMPEGGLPAGEHGPLTLELGCGRGEYTLDLARMNPDGRFAGVDIKGARMWHGATTAIAEGLDNVFFIRTRIELLRHYMSPASVSEIWIPFPEPFHEKPNRHARRRLTSPGYLDMYRTILAPGGAVNLKTDSAILYHYTLGCASDYGCSIIHSTDDLYASSPAFPSAMIPTAFEKRYRSRGIPIHYIRFTFPGGY